jgi:yecA family protein
MGLMVYGLIASYSGIVDIMQDYDELNEILITSGAGIHASECHGFLCALICGNGQVQEQKIRDYFLLDTDEIANPEECFMHLKALAEEIEAQMHSSDLELVLLLENENEPLAERSRSLAEWCQGFMSGLGLSGVTQEQIPPESEELIDDFYKIAYLDADNEDESDQGNDFALMELTEYVRMGTLFIFEDLQENTDSTDNSDQQTPEVLH